MPRYAPLSRRSYVSIVATLLASQALLRAQAAPSNDACSAATAIGLGVHVVDNRGASDGAPGCASSRDVWFFFDAPCAGQVSAVVVSPSLGFTPTLAAWDACPSAGSEIACAGSGSSRIDFSVQIGQRYWIRLGGDSGTTGTARLTLNCAPVTCSQGYVWTTTTPTNCPSACPSARYDHAMVYDSLRQVSVLFGGRDTSGFHADTWEWYTPTSTWNRRLPAAGSSTPTSRYGHAMAYDSGRNRAVLFGGWDTTGRRGDTYEWDGSRWERKAVSGGSPSPRMYHAMAYDSIRGEVVLCGGSGVSGALGDTWTWNGNTWTRVATTGLEPRFQHGMAFSPSLGRVIAFGGTNGSTCFNDTRGWSNSWVIYPLQGSGPERRIAHEIAWNTLENELVLVGGTTVGCEPGGAAIGDTLTWNAGWTRESAVGQRPRFGHAMTFDESSGVLVVHGGAGTTALLDDTVLGAPGVSNDDFAGAILVTSSSVRSVDTRCATSSSTTTCAHENDLFYRYVADCDGQVDFSITGASFVPQIAVFGGFPPGPQLACEQGISGFVTARFPVVANQEYTIRVGATGGAGGVGSLHVSRCQPQVCPPQISIRSQTQILVEVNGIGRGQAWSWCIEWLAGFACEYQAVSAPGTAADVAAAWVRSIRAHPCPDDRLTAQQLPAPNDHRFIITVGGRQPFVNLLVGAAGQSPRCAVTTTTTCPFNPDASLIALSGRDCDANGMDDTIDLLIDEGRDEIDVGDDCDAVPTLLRGDANNDEKVDISDGIRILNYLFSVTEPFACRDAADANDDGKNDLSDAIKIFSYSFAGAEAPPAPGPRECGVDPTDDRLDCLRSSCSGAGDNVFAPAD